MINIIIFFSVNKRFIDLYENEIDFSIDASHELALFIWNNGNGVPFKKESLFCIKEKPSCASFVAPFVPCVSNIIFNKL